MSAAPPRLVRAAVFASGRGTNFEVLADRGALSRSWEVVLLVTDRPRAGAIERARARGMPVAVEPPGDDPSDFGRRLLGHLADASVDVILLAGYLRLVPEAVVKTYSNRILNVHPALLPHFGGKGMFGARVHTAVLESGARISGVTVHFVNEVYDQGAILAQWPVPVLSDDTPETLAARVHEMEHQLYPAAVDALARAIADGSAVETIPTRGRHFTLDSSLPKVP